MGCAACRCCSALLVSHLERCPVRVELSAGTRTPVSDRIYSRPCGLRQTNKIAFDIRQQAYPFVSQRLRLAGEYRWTAA